MENSGWIYAGDMYVESTLGDKGFKFTGMVVVCVVCFL